jgi:uncharacterized repeat protein (TIGR02543 family)
LRSKSILALLLALLFCLPWCLAAPLQPLAEDGGYGYIFLLKEDSPILLSSQEEGIAPIAYADGYYTAQSLADLQPYLDAGVVELAVPNAPLELFSDPITNDPGAASQWYLESLGIAQAWQAGLDGNGVTVAVIDSGLVQGHEDINYNTVQGHNFLGGTTNDPTAWGDTRSNGHGSHVAGIIAAQAGNALGGAGLADGVTLLPLRCFAGSSGGSADSGSGQPSTIVSALGYALEQGADIVNMSFGGTNLSTLSVMEPMLQRLDQEGVILVAAAGNGNSGSYEPYNYPAAFDCVIGVGNVDQNYAAAFNSQRNDSVFIAAPGVDIYSLSNTSSTSYRTLSGTSMAAPMVSSLAALAKQIDPAIDNEGFRTLLLASSTDAGEAGYDTSYGNGIVSGARLTQVLTTPQPIIYHCTGGALPQVDQPTWSESYSIGRGGEVTLPTPVRKGYTFAGWHTDAACASPAVTAIPAGSVEAVSLYASWTPNLSLDRTQLYLRTDGSLPLILSYPAEELMGLTPLWESSNPSVAQVDQAGLVQAVAPGQAVITATVGAVSVQCQASVLLEAESYLVSFRAEGALVAQEVLPLDATQVVEPPIPAKEGYHAQWETYTLSGQDLEISALYERHSETAQVILPSETALGYTQFTCSQCEAVRRENYTLLLTLNGAEQVVALEGLFDPQQAALALAARYHSSGRLLELQVVQVSEGGLEQSISLVCQEGEHTRLFLLDTSWSPLCPSIPL